MRPAPTRSTLRPLEIAEDLRRERRRGRRHGGRALADRRLGPDTLAELQRLAEHPVEQRAGGGGVEGGSHLAEDLALARDQGVEPGRDAEEMERRRVVVHPVGDRAQRLAGELLERRERPRAVAVGEVDLGAVARREADGVAERPRERRRALERQRDALPQLDGRDVVGDADEREASEVAPRERRCARGSRARSRQSARWAARRPVARAARNPA